MNKSELPCLKLRKRDTESGLPLVPPSFSSLPSQHEKNNYHSTPGDTGGLSIRAGYTAVMRVRSYGHGPICPFLILSKKFY
jgi:hypothetical protein